VRSSLRAEVLVELQIQDSIMAGRSPLELAYLLIGGAAGWSFFQIPAPLVMRIVMASAVIAAGLGLAFVRVAGQDLTAWCLALIRYVMAPRLALYGPGSAA
jgi:hypothetical protein